MPLSRDFQYCIVPENSMLAYLNNAFFADALFVSPIRCPLCGGRCSMATVEPILMESTVTTITPKLDPIATGIHRKSPETPKDF